MTYLLWHTWGLNGTYGIENSKFWPVSQAPSFAGALLVLAKAEQIQLSPGVLPREYARPKGTKLRKNGPEFHLNFANALHLDHLHVWTIITIVPFHRSANGRETCEASGNFPGQLSSNRSFVFSCVRSFTVERDLSFCVDVYTCFQKRLRARQRGIHPKIFQRPHTKGALGSLLENGSSTGRKFQAYHCGLTLA